MKRVEQGGWLRRTPLRSKSWGSTAFGSSTKRFDPAIKIIDWTSSLPIVSTGEDETGRERPQGVADSQTSLTSDAAATNRARTAGLRRRRTPWAPMQSLGAGEQHVTTDPDIGSLWLQGHMHATPRGADTQIQRRISSPPDRRPLHSGGVTAWDSLTPSRGQTCASQRQQRPENSRRTRPATEAKTGTTDGMEQASNCAREIKPGYVREVSIKSGAKMTRAAHIGEGEHLLQPASPTSLTDCFNEGNFMPLYDLVSDEHNQAEVEDMWGLSPASPAQHNVANASSLSLTDSKRAFLRLKRQTLSDSIAVEKCSPCKDSKKSSCRLTSFDMRFDFSVTPRSQCRPESGASATRSSKLGWLASPVCDRMYNIPSSFPGKKNRFQSSTFAKSPRVDFVGASQQALT